MTSGSNADGDVRLSGPCPQALWSNPDHIRVPNPPAGFVEFREADVDQTIPGRFEQQVGRRPDAVAVKVVDRILTYCQLNEAANRVARAILGRSGAGTAPVAILVNEPATAVIGIVAAVKAGRPVVPLDASLPATRLGRIIEQSQAQVILTGAGTAGLVRSLSCTPRDALGIDALDHGVSPDNLGLPISPSAIEQIVYTSGTTAEPKGVYRTHRAALHTVMVFTNSVCICSDDRLLLLFHHSHGAGMNGILTALLNGATVVPFDVRTQGLGALADVMAADAITLYYSVPTVFRAFAHSVSGRRRFPSLRLIDLSGEPVTRRDVDLYRAIAPDGCFLRNHLGSSEAGFHSWYFVGKDTRIEGGLVPAGYAVPTVTTLLLDESGKTVEVGAVGEITVQHPYLECGYWRDPERTRQAFGCSRGVPRERVFRTGDLGKLLPDHRLVVLGRKDAQVKIRGYRVEPAEVEAVLREHPSVRDVAVVARPEPLSGEARLVAYLVVGTPVDTQGLRRAVGNVLPQHMIPAAFVVCDALPVLPSGKIDHRSLPVPMWPDGESDVPPESMPELYRRLTYVWKEVLEIRQIGRGENLFDLGGDSLSAVRILSRVEQLWRIRLSPSAFLVDPTIAHLAALVQCALQASSTEAETS